MKQNYNLFQHQIQQKLYLELKVSTPLNFLLKTTKRKTKQETLKKISQFAMLQLNTFVL